MKLLMEKWRRFLNENKEEYLKTLGLYVTKTDGEYNIYLYEWNNERFRLGWPMNLPGQPMIVGTLGTMEMPGADSPEPCIPTTQEIGKSAVIDKRQGKGIGSHMYEVAAYYMKMEQDGGITSDHSASTTKDAAKVWLKLKNKLNYIKRKTPKGPDKETFNPKTGEVLPAYKGGNDEYDYNNSTPDPNDDCYMPSDGEPASPHSLQIPPDRIGYIAKLMEIQMDNFDKMVERTKRFDPADAAVDGARLFDKEYQPDKTGIYGHD